MSDTLVVIGSDGGRLHKITKICPFSDGFAALVPYHSSRQGFLMKNPVSFDRLGFQTFDELIPFTANDRVKLSVHWNGFVQFSGIDTKRIISGRDPITGKPRGLALVGDTPVRTTSGPLFHVLIWGLDQFELLGSATKNACEFTTDDFYHRKAGDIREQPAYMLEFFQLQRSLMNFQRLGPRGPFVRCKLPYDSPVVFRQDLRIIELPNQPYFLGCMVSRTFTDFPCDSGYVMKSPACRSADDDQFYGITAIYPRFGRGEGTSLDRPNENDCIDGPADLSANPAYIESFGQRDQ
jgi:hypothetical protein